MLRAEALIDRDSGLLQASLHYLHYSLVFLLKIVLFFQDFKFSVTFLSQFSPPPLAVILGRTVLTVNTSNTKSTVMTLCSPRMEEWHVSST